MLARAPGSTGDEGLSLFTVAGDAKGLTRTPLKTLDPTRKLARLEFNAVDARATRRTGEGRRHRSPARSTSPPSRSPTRWSAARRSCAEQAMDYAQMRMQFGRPIASFQSLKHKAADMLADVELAKSAAYYAAAGRRRGRPGPARARLARQGARVGGLHADGHPRRSRSTAASASPGTTTRISGSSAPRAPRCSSATRPITASC